MKQKLVALILAVAVALSLAGCTEEVKQTEEPKESETYSNDFEAGVKNVTVQDLTYSVPTAWEKRRGENGFTYYYPASGDSFLAVSFNEINAKNHSITEWENFNTYLSAMEGDDYKNVSKEMRQNKNKVEYAHHAGKLNVGSDAYDINRIAPVPARYNIHQRALLRSALDNQNNGSILTACVTRQSVRFWGNQDHQRKCKEMKNPP